jgi:predicted DNA-binding ribbon-helix-helix protein
MRRPNARSAIATSTDTAANRTDRLAKRSITVAGHRTSVSLEEPFWQALTEIARREDISLAALIGAIDRRRPPATNLSAAIRLHILDWYRSRVRP